MGALRLFGFKVAVPTTVSSHGETPGVTVELHAEGCAAHAHSYSLEPDTAAALGRSLVEAAARGESRDVEFSVPDDEPSSYLLAAPAARALGAAIDETLVALAARPPFVSDRPIGTVDATTSDGSPAELDVYVSLLVPVEGFLRIHLATPTGTWTFDDDLPALADALARAASAEVDGPVLALEPHPNEAVREPWLTVAAGPGGLVSLRLYDDLVQARGVDGVLFLRPDDARRLAALAREARAFCDQTPPRVAVAPEPFERVVAIWPAAAAATP
jgi:hypothetical protein